MGIAAVWIGVAAVVLLVVLIVLGKGLYIIREYQLGIVERLGKYTGSPTKKGLHWRRVVFDKLIKLDMRGRNIPIKVEARTISDGVGVVVHGQAEFRVNPTMVYEAQYNLTDPWRDIAARVDQIVTELLYTMSFTDALTGMQSIADGIKSKIAEYVTANGFMIINIVITKVEPERSVLEAMQLQAAQSRKRAILDGEADAENARIIAKAKAEAEADALTTGASAAETGERIVALMAAAKRMAELLGISIEKAMTFVLDAEDIAAIRAVATRDGTTHVFMGGGTPTTTSAAIAAKDSTTE